MLRELKIDFLFTESEKNVLVDSFLNLRLTPYKFYPAFKKQVRDLLLNLPEIQRFREFIDHQRSISTYDFPFVFIENCPIDPVFPELGNDDPVKDKYDKKKTFVAECFLQLYAELSAQHPIAYLNVNDGDVFQDIFPKESLKYSQSQKALGTVHFHKDFPNHFVRPDFVNIISLVSSDDNEIYTMFTSNKDILDNISAESREKLRQCEFYTPYDDITLNTANIELGRAEDHCVLVDKHHLRFFENRTMGLNPNAQAAIDELVAVTHKYKKCVLMQPGDFVSISNNLSLHGREVVKISNETQAYKRWSLKTVNVYSSAPHIKHFVNGTDYLVNG